MKTTCDGCFNTNCRHGANMGEEDYKKLVTIAAKHLTLEDCPAQETVQLQVQPISQFVISCDVIQKIDKKKWITTLLLCLMTKWMDT